MSGEANGGRRVLWLTALLVYLPICILLLAAQWAANRRGISLSMLTREPQSALQGPWWVGTISNVGVLIWCVAATACFLGYLVLRPRPDAWRGFLLAAGVLTTCLLIDDAFMLHDGLLWSLAHIPETVVIGAWGLGGLSWLVYFRRLILRTDYPLLVVACICFGLSVVLDLELLPIRERYHALGEDGFKLLGIASWAVYLGTTCVKALRGEYEEEPQRGGVVTNREATPGGVPPR